MFGEPEIYDYIYWEAMDIMNREERGLMNCGNCNHSDTQTLRCLHPLVHEFSNDCAYYNKMEEDIGWDETEQCPIVMPAEDEHLIDHSKELPWYQIHNISHGTRSEYIKTIKKAIEVADWLRSTGHTIEVEQLTPGGAVSMGIVY